MPLIPDLKSNLLFKNTFIYTVMQLVNKGIPFLIIPILAQYLTPDDYGQIATFNTLVGVFSVFIGLSAEAAVSVNFFHLKPETLKIFIGNLFIVLTCSLLLVFLFSLLMHSYLTHWLYLGEWWIYLAVVVALTQTITFINLELWRTQQQAKPYALYSIFQSAFNIGVSLILIIVFELGWSGRIAGSSSAYLLFGLISVWLIFKRGFARLVFDTKAMGAALKFGIPLIPHKFALWMRSGIDIFLITTLVGLSQTGLYSIGYQFGAIVGILATAFNSAYAPYLFEQLTNHPQNKRNIVKFFYLYALGIMLFSIMLDGVFRVLVPVFLPEAYQSATQYIFWIAIAHAFVGMYNMAVNYIYYVKKTHILSGITVSTSLFHLVASFILIQLFGAIGAAYATVLSFGVTFLITWRYSQKVYSMPWFYWMQKVKDGQ